MGGQKISPQGRPLFAGQFAGCCGERLLKRFSIVKLPYLQRGNHSIKYAELIKVFAADTLVDPVEISNLVAEHQAELTVARLALAVAASKTDGRYPDSLDGIARRFGGVVPLNPYNEKPVDYETRNESRYFSITIASPGGQQVDFNSASPSPVN